MYIYMWFNWLLLKVLESISLSFSYILRANHTRWLHKIKCVSKYPAIFLTAMTGSPFWVHKSGKSELKTPVNWPSNGIQTLSIGNIYNYVFTFSLVTTGNTFITLGRLFLCRHNYYFFSLVAIDNTRVKNSCHSNKSILTQC